jgi:hypothetical protein
MKREVTSIVALGLLSLNCFAHTHRHHHNYVDPSYSSALAAANHFLQAWQTEDHETGIGMLSDSARQHASSDELQNFFSPGPEAAYEIAHGWRTNAGAYIFPVVLFSKSGPKHPQASTIVVSPDGRHDWSVDKLP